MLTRVTSEGRIQIPAPLRKEVGITDGDLMDAETVDGSIILTRMEPRCKLCNAKDPQKIDGILICSACIEKLRRL